jgi:putative tryptophan/tyrosine transport system substrate-binding protein
MQIDQLKRRDFIALLGGAVASWPLAARAQQPALPVIGFLRSTPLAPIAYFVASFRAGLREAGFVEGQNVAIEFRSAEIDLARLPALVAELLQRQVAVIVANNTAAPAAIAATSTVPIVFATGSDPVLDGLVASLNRPDRNVTGVSFLGSIVGTKRVELLLQLAPAAATIGMIVNPGIPETSRERDDVLAAVQALGRRLIAIDVASDREIERAFATLAERGVAALLVGAGGFTNVHRERLAELAARHRLPSSFSIREGALAGGLMSYGASPADAYRQVGIYVGRILKGEKPADLPVMQSTKFELVLNLRTAKALGIEVPDRMLALADEVIE